MKINYFIKLCAVGLLASVFLMLSGCYSTNGPHRNPFGGPYYSESNQVRIVNNGYYPGEIVINRGQSVTWVNQDRVMHTVTSNQGYELFSGDISPGQSYTHVFKDRGVYRYHNRYYPRVFSGVVIVR